MSMNYLKSSLGALLLANLICQPGLMAQVATTPPVAVPAAAAAPAIPAPPRANAAIIPKLNAGFQRAHQGNVEIAKKGDIDVLFMGDSITDWWRNPGRGAPINGAIPYGGKAVFEKHFGSLKVANFGIAGDTTQGVLYRLQNGEGQGFQPKAVMLMIGIPSRRRRWMSMFVLLWIVAAAGAIGCGGGGSGSSSTSTTPTTPATTAGSYTFTVTATSGTLTASTTIPLSVQ